MNLIFSLICLKTLNKKEKEHHFGIIRNPSTASKNALSKRTGSKKSDRIGTKASARNYIRTTDDISTLVKLYLETKKKGMFSDCHYFQVKMILVPLQLSLFLTIRLELMPDLVLHFLRCIPPPQLRLLIVVHLLDRGV